MFIHKLHIKGYFSPSCHGMLQRVKWIIEGDILNKTCSCKIRCIFVSH